MEKLIIEIDEELKCDFKVKVAKERKTTKEVLTGLIEKYVNASKRPRR